MATLWSSDTSVLLALLLPGALAAGLLWMARQALKPWRLDRRSLIPVFLIHRWSMGSLALLAIYIFFVAPSLILGQYAVAGAGFAFATLVVVELGRDIWTWIVEDLREHRREGRGLFEHGVGCAGRDRARVPRAPSREERENPT